MLFTAISAYAIVRAQGVPPPQYVEPPLKPIVFVSAGAPKVMDKVSALLRDRKPAKGWRVVWKEEAIYAVSEGLAEIRHARRMQTIALAFAGSGPVGQPVDSARWSAEAQQALAEVLGELFPGVCKEDGSLRVLPMIAMTPKLRLVLQAGGKRETVDLSYSGAEGATMEERRAIRQELLRRLNERHLQREGLLEDEAAKLMAKPPPGWTVWLDGLSPLNAGAPGLRRQAIERTDEVILAVREEVQKSLEAQYRAMFASWPTGQWLINLPPGTSDAAFTREQRLALSGQWPSGATLVSVIPGFELSVASEGGGIAGMRLWN